MFCKIAPYLVLLHLIFIFSFNLLADPSPREIVLDIDNYRDQLLTDSTLKLKSQFLKQEYRPEFQSAAYNAHLLVSNYLLIFRPLELQWGDSIYFEDAFRMIYKGISESDHETIWMRFIINAPWVLAKYITNEIYLANIRGNREAITTIWQGPWEAISSQSVGDDGIYEKALKDLDQLKTTGNVEHAEYLCALTEYHTLKWFNDYLEDHYANLFNIAYQILLTNTPSEEEAREFIKHWPQISDSSNPYLKNLLDIVGTEMASLPPPSKKRRGPPDKR